MPPVLFRILLAASLAMAVLLPVPARAQTEVPYTIEIRLQGLDDPALAEALRGASQLVALEKHPPPSVAALRRRAQDDLSRLETVMQGEGYWTARLAYVLDSNARPATVTVTVAPGPLFHFARIAFRSPSGAALPLLDRLGPAAFGLRPGDPARSAPVAAANDRIVEQYAHDGRPFAKVTDRTATVDVASDTMSVTFTVDPGPAARFGPTTIDGLQRVDRDFVERRIDWRLGAPYDSRVVEAVRQDLVKSGLFAAVRITHAEAPDAAGEVPMTVSLVEGPPRSVGTGIGYNTNFGAGANAQWEHRNLFGEGESLRLSSGVAQRQLGLAANFRKPDFLSRDQSFLTNSDFLQQNTPAYRSLRGDLFSGVERPLLPSLIGSAGIAVVRANVQSIFGNENYMLLGAPVNFRRDTTDNLLDPTVGSRQIVSLTPFHSLAGRDLNFVTSRLEERLYHRLDSDGHVVLAGFGAFGSILGASLDALPADTRLYAGGAGSVRGYGYQRAGPIGPDNVPLGGVSSVELGVELRYRITDTIGLVPFVEGGNVYPRILPNSIKLFYGGGLGLRYYTPIGPVRLDLATPFERRPGDSPIQVYISLGQAF